MINLFAVVLVLIGTMFGAFGSLLFKKGSTKISITNRNLIFGFILHAFAAIIYIIALKMERLSVLYPIVSLNYIWVCLLSMHFLHEKMNGWKWFGILVIIIGVSIIGLGS